MVLEQQAGSKLQWSLALKPHSLPPFLPLTSFPSKAKPKPTQTVHQHLTSHIQSRIIMLKLIGVWVA